MLATTTRSSRRFPSFLKAHKHSEQAQAHSWTQFATREDFDKALQHERVNSSNIESSVRAFQDTESITISTPDLSDISTATTPSRKSSATSCSRSTHSIDYDDDKLVNVLQSPRICCHDTALSDEQYCQSPRLSSMPGAFIDAEENDTIRSETTSLPSHLSEHNSYESKSGSSSVVTAIESRQAELSQSKTEPKDSTDASIIPTNKGKGKLTSILDISWEHVAEEDVSAFCAAYDQVHNHARAHHEKMGTTSSTPTLSNLVASNQDVQYNLQERMLKGRSVRPEGLIKTNTRLHERTQRRIAEYSARMMANTALLDARLQQLLQRQYASEMIATEEERLRVLHAQEEAGRAAALALQQELDLQCQVEEELRIQEEKNLAAAEALQAELDEQCRLEEERARRRECNVCGDEKDRDEFPEKASSKCQHESMVCSECLNNWITSALVDHGIDGIKCPECPERLCYKDVQMIASPATFEAYDKATFTNALSSLQDFAWCLAPACKSGQLNIENSNYMECMSCHYKQCLHHKTAWHSGETCAEYDHRESGAKAREEEEQKTLAMLDTMSKLCPGPNCGWRIQKTDGCDHVTCRKCRFEFCWQCLASHAEIKKVGNTAHLKTCKFHSTNLDLAWPFNRH